LFWKANKISLSECFYCIDWRERQIVPSDRYELPVRRYFFRKKLENMHRYIVKFLKDGRISVEKFQLAV
jgi:hypothetical protein